MHRNRKLHQIFLLRAFFFKGIAIGSQSRPYLNIKHYSIQFTRDINGSWKKTFFFLSFETKRKTNKSFGFLGWKG